MEEIVLQLLLLILVIISLAMLILVVVEIISAVKTKKPKLDLPPNKIDYDQNQLTLFMWRKAEYLTSKEWKLKRNQVKERDNHACQICGSTKDLHVHHMSGYNLIPNEPISCLITLCNVCHKDLHDMIGYPKTYSDYMKFNHPIKPNNIH